jgi:hypothetical protein
MIGIDTQNIAGLGSPQILFYQNPHGGFDLSYPTAPVVFYPLYPELTYHDYIGFWTPLVPRNNPGRNP